MKAYIVLLTLVWSVSCCFAEDVDITYFNVSAHISLDEKTGKMTGALYELLEKHIAPVMGVTFVWDKQPTSIPRQLRLLESGDKDAAALLIYSPARTKVCEYTQKPYFLSQSAIAVHKSSSLEKVSSVEDILGLKIGYCKGAFLTPFMRDERIQLDLLGHPDFLEINYKKLLKKRLDAAYAPDKAGLLYMMNRMHLEQTIRIMDLPEKPAPFHVVFTKKKKGLAKRYNKAFDDVLGQQKYLEILENYLDISKL